MVDSEDEFTQLCSKLLKRVKKTRPPDSRDVPKSSTAARSKFKKPKPSATKSQAGNEDTKRDDQGITSGSDHEKSAERNEPSESHGASSKTRGLQTQDHPSNVDTQRASSGRAGTEPPKLQDQPSVTHMVLERMQQFKRAVPSRMKSSTAEDGDPVSLSSIADLPESDRALTVGLPIDLNQQHRSLEDQGLFFCQLCQKDLTAMNSALREQHVNRCLDQNESLGRVSDLSSVPSCPLCGKPFSTEKSRASHLKRCAVKLEVPAQTLLQAVQRQNNETGPEVTAGVSRAKRKAGSRQKEPPKKRKPAQPGSEVEELLVAMALSRSMQEDTAAASIASGMGPDPAREVTVPVKKSRRKQKHRRPPLLLVQDPQAPMQRLQERMSLLLGEESEAIITGRLPPSHFWDMEENQKAAWVQPQREGKRGVLWEISNLVENIELLNYYTKELNPFIIPWKPPPKLLNSEPFTMTRSLPSSPCAFNSTKEPSHGIPCRASPHLSSSQKERQALLDLAELAGEGMTLTQWNAAPTRAINSTGRDSVGSLPSSGFVPTLHEESIAPSRHLQPDAPLVHLAADFMEMVNNPHLSDAQLQTDCGEVLSVHMFVLYTRCPLLVEAVHSEGFWVDEAGTGRIQRFLLNDVSAEAALSFLRFLYCASSGIPAHCLAHVCELARRFGVTSLIETCERLVDDPQYAGTQGVAEEDEDDGEERAETFQGLLKSMWVDEGEVVADSLPEDGSEEEKADVEGVGEGELEEIYEFAATQRRMTEDVCGGSSSEHDAGQLCMESDDCPLEVAVQTVPANGQQRYPEILAQLTAPSAPSDGVMPVNTSVRLSSHRIERSPAKIPLSTPVSTIRVSVSAAQTCHPAVSVSRQLFGKPVSRNKSEHGRCTRYSPSPLDDTYDQMFSETCGEYAESSAISSSSANVNVTHPGDGKRPQKPLASLPQLGRSPNLLAFPPKPQPLNKTTQKSPSNSHPRCRISAASPPTSRFPSLHFLASPERTQRTTPKSVASSPISRSPSLPYPASPDSIEPKTPKSAASSPSSRSPIQHFLASPDSIQPPSPKSVASPPTSRFLASPDSIQPTTPKSVTSPVYSQPCSLPSGSFLSNSPQLQNSPLLASPRNSLSSLASPQNSQPQSLPSLASPPKSRPASLISTDSSPGKQRSLQSPSNSQHRTPRSSNRSPTRPNTSSPNTKTDEQGVILILSSDEESEPSVNAREALHTQRTCDTDACGGIKESPMSFLERRSTEGLGRLEMSSSTDTSWLIPATPLCHATAAHTSQNQASHQPLQRPNSSVSSKVALHDLSGSPSQAKSPISPPKLTPKSPGDQTTSKISPSVHNTPGERKTLSSFGSKGSHVPSSLPTSPASSSVFEVGDSDDDAPGSETQPDPINHSFYIDYEPPIHMEDEMWLDKVETPQRPTSIPEEKTPSPRKNSPGAIKPLLEVSPEESCREESLHAAAMQSSGQSFLNPQLWDKWEEDDEGDDLPATLPLFERLNKIPDNRTKLKTPVSLVQKRELPPKVPITPLPSYSDMDTPVLKKELNRFGVRALPKKQMVLKLKEIFQYTHQVMSSGSDDEVPSSQQVQKQKHSSTSQPPRPARKEMPTGGGKVQNGPQAKRAKKLASVCSVQEADKQPLTASQESTASSAAASDTSSLSQSSGGNEFETAFAEEDDEEPCAPSQEAGRQVATAEAVRRFIEEHPELYKRILMYQPLDLAAVQVELKQSGIKMAAGKLLDFLDAHCVTFTTAATRREKKIPRRRKGGKRY